MSSYAMTFVTLTSITCKHPNPIHAI